MEEVPGSERRLPADVVFLALGFLGPEELIPKKLSLKLDGRSNIQTSPGVSSLVFIDGSVTHPRPPSFSQRYATSMDGVFACGDCRRCVIAQLLRSSEDSDRVRKLILSVYLSYK